MAEDQPTAPIVRPYVPPARAATDPGDPGPIPPHPRSSTTVLPVDQHVTLGVTRNVGYTGRTGLTVVKGETTMTVALPATTVHALRAALYRATVPTSSGGGRS
jgi:hypothetical protein